MGWRWFLSALCDVRWWIALRDLDQTIPEGVISRRFVGSGKSGPSVGIGAASEAVSETGRLKERESARR